MVKKAFPRQKAGAFPPHCNPRGCKPEKTAVYRGKQKPGKPYSMGLPGVEMTGFEPAAFWSRTKYSAAFSDSRRLLPRNTVKCRCCRLFPPVSLLFRLFPVELTRTFGRFLHFYRCNPTLQPFGLQHESSLSWNKPDKKLIRRINRNGSPGEMRSVSCNNAIYA